jgi:t-SNARE complex subunit (syntaxin)
MSQHTPQTEIEVARLRELRARAGELYTVEACREVIADLLDILIDKPLLERDEMLSVLKDWLHYAEENLSEFDGEPCMATKLCPRCESAGCIYEKIRKTKAVIATSARA